MENDLVEKLREFNPLLIELLLRDPGCWFKKGRLNQSAICKKLRIEPSILQKWLADLRLEAEITIEEDDA